MASLLEKIFGSYSDRELKKIAPIVNKILALDEEMQGLRDEELKGKTEEFKDRYKNGESLDDILPEAFAVVREASDRVLGMKHFPVQIYGGLILHQGRIAEMKTGEGKTLVATLPSYLNALTGKGVHIITVNDYLARRDKDWMGKIHEFLGLSVGCIVHGITKAERREAYNSDITYGTNNEFGFDYLRDNMVIRKDDMAQRQLYYGIVDEVDSILVDEARTPLIISGKGDESTKLYSMANSFTLNLTSRKIDPNESKNNLFDREIKEETVDFLIDEKAKKASLTDKGIEKAERFFGVENFADLDNMEIAHHINQALKARAIMKRDIDYVVKEGEVLIVDEFTGRLMEGRRYSDGLHQAIEAKENLNIKSESKTLATITFQNYFRMYDKLSGMTGTAQTEEEEFREIYNMDVVEIPTNEPVIREDLADSVYKNEKAKFGAVLMDIKERHSKGQPILVGTITIDSSEKLSRYLKKERIRHEVLNAKYHEREAEIVAQAGRLGAVTIATNMAGRGTDIVLGGNPDYLAMKEMKAKGFSDEILAILDDFTAEVTDEVLEAKEIYKQLVKKHRETTDKEHQEVVKSGGLHIVGTERHESRRIDNQLRGRAGRQGDPGSSKFYISLEDDLMRLFAGDRFKGIVETMKMPEDEPLEHPILTRTIENAQKKVEGNNFAIRKHVLKYDDVMNKQREVIYAQRRDVLNGVDLKENIRANTIDIIEKSIGIYTGGNDNNSEWDMEGLRNFLMKQFNLSLDSSIDSNISSMSHDSLISLIKDQTADKYRQREEALGEKNFREAERVILLQVVDRKWMDHIDAMDQLRQGIGLRAYGQQDPVRAYQIEGFDMFEEMSNEIWEETVGFLFNIERAENVERKQVARPTTTNKSDNVVQNTVVRKSKKIGRNEPCPCGSGKKYKKCCGANV